MQKQIQPISGSWSNKFNFFTPFSLLRCLILFLYVLFCFYEIILNPSKNYGHFSLELIVILLSFYPKWTVSIGTKGILFKQNIIFWDQMKLKRILSTRNYMLLELEWNEKDSNHKRSQKIPVPLRFKDEILEKINQEK